MKEKYFLHRSLGFSSKTAVIVISIIAFVLVFLFVGSSQNTASNRDAKRMADLNALANAITKRASENQGVFSGVNIGNGKICPEIPSIPTMITADNYTTTRTVGLDCLVTAYILAIPKDPSIGYGAVTGYKVYADANGKIHIIAEATEPDIPRSTPLMVIR